MKVVIDNEEKVEKTVKLLIHEPGSGVRITVGGFSLVEFRNDGTIHILGLAREYFDYLHFWPENDSKMVKYNLSTGEILE